MDEINMKVEERVAWACALAAMAVIAGICAWRLSEAKKVAQTLPPEPDVLARLDALEARAEAQAKMRCFNVKTDRLDVAIFPVENLGVKK